MKLLHIDSSPRPGSYSRALSKSFVDSFLSVQPDTQIVRRDLVETPPPFVDGSWIANAFAPGEVREAGSLAVSDELTEEFLSSDILVLGLPMYNFGLPAIVKAWVDQIMRAGLTFQYTEAGIQGLAIGKTVVVALARSGGYSPGAPAEALNFQEPYIRTLFGVMGITDLHFLVLEDVFSGEINYKLTERQIEASRLAREIALQRKNISAGLRV